MTKWPDWCPKYGWDTEYTDTPEWSSHDPYDEDPRNPVPEALKDLLASDPLLMDLLEGERDPHSAGNWTRVKMPTPTRKNWLSRSPAKRWVETAKALGAEAHIEKGWVIWEDELNEKIAKVKEGL